MFIKVIALVLGISGCLALPDPTKNHDRDMSIFFDHTDPTSKVVGGTVAEIGSAPHMVALTSGILIRSFFCGGSLVSPRHVLTAAHCIEAVYIFGQISSNAAAVVGTDRWNVGGTSYSFSGNVSHEHYVGSTIKNDIGLLITSQEVEYSDLVRPVRLAFDHVEGGVLAKVNGWGRTQAGGSISARLLELYLMTLDGERCAEEVARFANQNGYNAPPIESHIEICTFRGVGHGTCNGDSGSALVRATDNRQIGIVSWGFPCALGAPDMFARVGAYGDWLRTRGNLLI